MNTESKAFMNANEVWKLARRFGGISVQYGSSMPVYEIIFPGHGNKCAVVIGEKGTKTVPEVLRIAAKSINQLCFYVTTTESLKNIFMKVSKGEYS